MIQRQQCINKSGAFFETAVQDFSRSTTDSSFDGTKCNILGNESGDSSSNPVHGCWHFTSC